VGYGVYGRRRCGARHARVANGRRRRRCIQRKLGFHFLVFVCVNVVVVVVVVVVRRL
jgi:hypothetical protein